MVYRTALYSFIICIALVFLFLFAVAIYNHPMAGATFGAVLVCIASAKPIANIRR